MSNQAYTAILQNRVVIKHVLAYRVRKAPASSKIQYYRKHFFGKRGWRRSFTVLYNNHTSKVDVVMDDCLRIERFSVERNVFFMPIDFS